jgi:hypothetical protein
MKTTANGYRIRKNGSVIKSIEAEAITRLEHEGTSIKENGTYYFFNRKQGLLYIYLP